jgi:hypothetical protein
MPHFPYHGEQNYHYVPNAHDDVPYNKWPEFQWNAENMSENYGIRLRARNGYRSPRYKSTAEFLAVTLAIMGAGYFLLTRTA